jgi:cytochrome c oxidase subunit 2
MKLGKATYGFHCAACHQPTDLVLPPTFPAIKGGTVATQGSVAGHVSLVLSGKGLMLPFGNSLTLKEIAAVVTYDRNAWCYNTDDIVQFLTVYEVRENYKVSFCSFGIKIYFKINIFSVK